MKREIKFRGVRSDGKGWVHGFYYEYNGKSIISSEDHSDDADTYYNDEVIPKSVGQYTGLKDKNGVEIYEGDQLYSTGYLCDIVFYDGCFRTVYEHPEDGETLILGEDINPSGMEVAGNTH